MLTPRLTTSKKSALHLPATCKRKPARILKWKDRKVSDVNLQKTSYFLSQTEWPNNTEVIYCDELR